MLSCNTCFSPGIYVQLQVQKKICQNINTSTLLFYGIQSLPAFFQKILPVQRMQSRVILSVFPNDVKWFHQLMWKARLKLLALLTSLLKHTAFEDPLHLLKPISGKI